MKISRQRKSEAVPNMAALSDIAFLLIIFFVLAAQFMKESGIKYDLPREENPDKILTSKIMVTIDEHGVIFLQGDEIAEDDVEPQVSALLGPENKKEVHFKCDAKQPRKVFEPVLIAITEAGGTIVPISDTGQPYESF